MDCNNWIIGNDGTNGTDSAETIDGTDRIYGTFGKLIITLDWRIWLMELMEPLELVEWKEEMTCTDALFGIDGNFKATGIDGIETV